MEDIRIHALATAFIERYSNTHAWDKEMVLQKVDKSATDWAIDEIHDITYERPAALWPLILEVLSRTDDWEVLAVLAAGPLEDYLAKRGAHVIAEIEARATTDAKFKRLLAGVWENSMSDEVWERVCRCRGEPW